MSSQKEGSRPCGRNARKGRFADGNSAPKSERAALHLHTSTVLLPEHTEKASAEGFSNPSPRKEVCTEYLLLLFGRGEKTGISKS